MWVNEEDHKLYDFGFARIPIHIMSRVSMWGLSLSSHDRTKKERKKESTAFLRRASSTAWVLVECLVSSIFGSMSSFFYIWIHVHHH
jgi:hypothetical protein